MKKALATLAIFALAAFAAKADTLADWTFENTGIAGVTGSDFTYGPADTGVQTAGSSMTGHHASATSAWSFAAGPGSARSLSATGWAVNDYFQFSLSTANYQDLQIGFDARGSNTGPRDFSIAYTTDGSTFTNFNTYTVANVSWNSTQTAPPTASHYSFDLSAIDSLENQGTVYFRLIDNSTTSITGGTVSSGGTSAIDNFTVSATAVPEPATIAMLTIGAGIMAGAMRRRLS